MFATHYHELVQLEQQLDGVVNYNVAVREHEGRVVFLHEIVPGGSDRSYGIHVARLAGIPSEVIDRAQEVLEHLETAHSTHARRFRAKETRVAPPPEPPPTAEESDQSDPSDTDRGDDTDAPRQLSFF